MAERGIRKRVKDYNYKPVRLFDGSAEPFAPFWRVVDQDESESGEAEIQFYGYISEYSWWGDEVTPGLFKAELDKLGGKPVTVRIHSGGGDVFAASAIRAMIMEYPGKVTTRIDGLCASAATYVAMAGDHVKMQDSAFFMIHDPWALAIGSADELKTAARMLDKVKQGIVETYQSKTTHEAAEISRLMSKETWFTASEAQAFGFVDEVVSGPGKSFEGMMDKMAIANAIRDYKNVPDEVKDIFTAENAESAEEPALSFEEKTTRAVVVGDNGRFVEIEADKEALEALPVVEDLTPKPHPQPLPAEQGGGSSEEDVTDEGEASETPEADAELEEAGEPARQEEFERMVKSLRDYIEVFG